MQDDPFASLGLERRFAIDTDALRRRFLEVSAANHPDRFPGPIEQAEAVEKMSRLTEAYRVLCDPELRAKALLALSGFEQKGDKDQLPPDLLMQVMEVREELESAIAASHRAELERLRHWAQDQRAAYLDQLGVLFERDLDADKAKRARLQLNALRYMQRMLEQIPG